MAAPSLAGKGDKKNTGPIGQDFCLYLGISHPGHDKRSPGYFWKVA